MGTVLFSLLAGRTLRKWLTDGYEVGTVILFSLLAQLTLRKRQTDCCEVGTVIFLTASSSDVERMTDRLLWERE